MFNMSPGFLGAALWTPQYLSNPSAIWLSDSSTVIDSGGGFCQQWNDLSPSGFNMGQVVVANQPSIISSGLNGHRTIKADGTNDRMLVTVTATSIFRNVSAGWSFFVMKKNSTSTGAVRTTFFVPTNNAADIRYGIFSDSSSAPGKFTMQVRRLDANSPTTLSSVTAINSGWHMGMGIMNWGTGAGSIYIDGSLDASNSTLTTAGSTSNTSSISNPYLFSTNSPLLFADEELAEVIVGSNSVPSASEIDKIFGYAAWKYGIYSLLPNGHPYKNAPPIL